MDRERLDRWCEKGILGLVLGILVFGPLAFGAVDAWQLSIIEWMTAGVMVLWVMRLWMARQARFYWPPICWALVAFVAYAVGRYWEADLEYPARKELMRILIYTFLFLAILNNLHRQEAAQVIALTVIFLGMGIAMYACWQYGTKSDRVLNVRGAFPGRGSGTFIYPNSLAGYLEILVPLALSYVLIGRMSHAMKVLLGYAAAAMLAGIGVTLSRGGWLVTAATLVIFCGVILAHRDYWVQGLVLAAVLLAGGIVVGAKGQEALSRLEGTFQGKQADDMRLSTWEAGIGMWRDHVWWGVGPAHYRYRFRQYRPEVLQMQPDRVHNDYLTVLVDWGVVGAVIVGSAWTLWWCGVFRAWKAVRGARDALAKRQSNKLALVIGGAVGIVAIMLHSVVDFNLHIPAIAILVVTLMALLSSQLRYATERYWEKAGPFLKCVATVALLAVGGCLAQNGLQAAREDYWLRQADRAGDYSATRLEALEKAHALEAMNFDTTYAIGEWYRSHSFMNMGGDPDVQAREAMKWYRLGMKLNPYDGYNWLRYGMCLDWLASGSGQPDENTATYYSRADELDPNGYYMSANIGWHFAQIGDNAAARSWFERSLQLEWDQNDIASNYLPIVGERLAESAAKQK